MRTILLVFADAKTAALVKNALVAAGLPVERVFSTGAALLRHALLEPEGSVIVLPARLSDLTVPDLRARLPDTFELVVLQSSGRPVGYGPLPGLTVLESPLPAATLVGTIRALLAAPSSRQPHHAYYPSRLGRRRFGSGGEAGTSETPPPHRSPAEERLLLAAKQHLINQCGLSEEQAHRTLQKRSMESGIRLVEIARRVLEETTCPPEDEPETAAPG